MDSAGIRCSVIVPAFNAEAHLESTMASVLGQTSSEWELIVVDDGSQDETAAVAGRAAGPRCRLLRQENHGVSHARNRGFSEARGDYVIFLDSDDLLAPEAVARLTAALDEDPSLAAAYGEVVACDESGSPLGTGDAPVFGRRPSGDVLKSLVQRNFVVSPGVLCLRRVAMARAGGFREDLTVAEDWECWCRLALEGPFRYLGGDPVLFYRHRPGSVVRSAGLDPASALACVEAVFENGVIARRLGGRSAALHRRAVAAVHAFTANQHLRDRRWAEARRNLWQAVRREPIQLREWGLFLCALVRYLPRGLGKHLK